MNEIKIPDDCKSIKINQESDNRIVVTFEPEKQEWVPKVGEECWYVAYDTCRSIFVPQFWKFDKMVGFNKLIKKTKQEIRALCDKLNAAIN